MLFKRPLLTEIDLWLERAVYSLFEYTRQIRIWLHLAHAGHKKRINKSFDDFIAAAEFLINQKYTDNNHLGIIGGSNGVYWSQPLQFKNQIYLKLYVR